MLSVLNRCGSSPDLPLHNSLSSVVYSSSKKRQLLTKPNNGQGAGPHFAALQRSRLVPLPINIRTGTLQKRDEEDSTPTITVAQPIETSPGLEMEEKLNYEITIASLKQRLALMEKEATRATKSQHRMEKDLDVLKRTNQSLQSERNHLIKQVEGLENTQRQQRHALDRLSERYSTVYGNLEKLTDVNASTNDPTTTSTLQTVMQTLARENQDLQRKLRVLETRHADDKTIIGNQEKRLKRLRAEMEALQHMQESANEHGTAGPTSSTNDPVSHHKITASHPSQPVLASVVASSSAANTLDDRAYIDPNILKVLEKVDSQFSITNAIQLSSVLKKWFHSCLQVVSSVDLHAVLRIFLQRVCELLHCQHAAVFQVDHIHRRLLGLVSERGAVRWELPLDKGILGHAARHNVICNVHKAYDDPRFYSATDTITNTKSKEVLCIPLTQDLEGLQPTSVFAVLQVWNTTHHKPFSPNDQIIGGLLGIQAGTVLLQTQVSESLQRVNRKVLEIVRMEDELAAKAVSNDGGDAVVSMVLLVRAAQKKCAEILGITKLRVFVLDTDVNRVWHVGSRLEASTSTNAQLVPIRKYAHVQSSLCALLLEDKKPLDTENDQPSVMDSSSCRILLDPTAEPMYNDTVDLKGGAHGLYLAPIRSPWSPTPLGMLQVARSAPRSTFPSDPADVSTDDALTMQLIELFCQVLASLLHHAMALERYEACPSEIQNARLAYLSERLEWLETEYLREQEEAEAEAARMEEHAMSDAFREQRLLQSALRDRDQERSARQEQDQSDSQKDSPLEPVPLISTDSMYAIDLGQAGSAEPEDDEEGGQLGDSPAEDALA
ncbi:hypothetical protein Poli38472_014380 [Pythium oligandrum]|uniref:GAF domain-containing protein n=1 Tax=Pythium oligandrum TaxID=41045 RepID=A0A8K1C871_PYTOL|nr:hypothetical protein Poli38472_014380 [Pythium oligandrum]|eukprot:TMW57777.1 hypothetical protein Poli38472_014380 [Pythium oligandrum]